MTVCANCEREVPPVYPGVDLPEAGLYFSPNSMGYYAGFFDNFPPDEEEKFGFAICHDCAVIFMLALPGLSKRLLPSRGGHPSKDFLNGIPPKACCAWTWTWDQEAPCPECGEAGVYLSNFEGGWDRRECPCGRLSQ